MIAMLTPERLREIKERCERATPGPWTSLSDDGRGLRTMNIKVVGRSPMMLVAQTAIGTTGGKIYDNGEDGRYDNAEFIAHAREDVPALVEEVDRLRLALEELIAAVECCPDEPDVIECHLSEAKAALGFMSGDDDG